MIWHPKRIILFNADLKQISIRHTGLMKEKKDFAFSAEMIKGIKWEGNEDGNKLFVQLSTEDVYLTSIGRCWANRNLDHELTKIVDSWKG